MNIIYAARQRGLREPLTAVVGIAALVLSSLWRIRHGGFTPLNTSSVILTEEERRRIVTPTKEEVFDETRLVRDFLHLIWDMTVRPQTWNWDAAKVSFGFYKEAAAYKFRHIFG